MRALILITWLWMAAAAAADTSTQQPELEGHCAMSAARGAELPTTCSVVWISPSTDKLYCFSSEEAKATFIKDPTGNEQRAQAFWKTLWDKRQQDRAAGAPNG